MKRFAVIGNPIEHSKSPVIHQMFAEQLGHKISYEKILSPLDGFAETIKSLMAKGYSGTNVTLPFKEDAFNITDQLSERAKLAGAVNTLSFVDGKIHGDNTDGQGLVEDLLRQTSFTGKKLLLVGAGGAARGSIFSLLSAGAAELHIVNRTAEKAKMLADKFDDARVTCVSMESLDSVSVDIIINSTSSSLTDELPFKSEALFVRASLAYDMVYKPELTSFEQYALSCNPDIKTQSGFGMLVGQAAESYRIWNGSKPDISAVIAQLFKK